MRQQINLFQPIFREERKLFSAATVCYSLAAVAVALLSFWAFGTWQVADLEREVIALRVQRDNQQKMAETAGALRSTRANPTDVRERIAKLSADLSNRTRAIELLRRGAAGEPTGFAARLTALARQHVDGLWINRLVLTSSAGAMSLSGRTVDADLVPRYLKALTSEPALRGTRFDDFSIERPEQKDTDPGVRFRASSMTVQAVTKEDRT